MITPSLYNLLIFTVAFTLTHSASAYTRYSNYTKKYLTVTSVEMVDLTKRYENASENLKSETPYKSYVSNNQFHNKQTQVSIGSKLDQVEFIVDRIINIGQKIWTVVEKGKPISNYTNLKATALPENATKWDQLENWQKPRSKIIGITYKNAYGIEVVRFIYRIVFLYGGSARGVGQYIGYAAVEPLEITVAYMYTFNARASVDAVYNMGSSQNPLAGMILNINWTVETVLKKSTMTHSYVLDGTGIITTPAVAGSKIITRINHLK